MGPIGREGQGDTGLRARQAGDPGRRISRRAPIPMHYLQGLRKAVSFEHQGPASRSESRADHYVGSTGRDVFERDLKSLLIRPPGHPLGHRLLARAGFRVPNRVDPYKVGGKPDQLVWIQGLTTQGQPDGFSYAEIDEMRAQAAAGPTAAFGTITAFAGSMASVIPPWAYRTITQSISASSSSAFMAS